MTTSANEVQVPVLSSQEVVAFDGSQPATNVGHFRYEVGDETWVWTDGLYSLHGYLPGETVPTTDLLLRHKHPDDRSRAFAVLEAAAQDGQPFSCYHRIIDRNDRVRSVLSVGHGVRDPEGRVAQVEGYFVDLTQVRRDETQVEVEAALTRIAVNREIIDEAKGMVMVATGWDGEAAFRYLCQCSQDANIKVHEIARSLVQAVSPDQRGSAFVMTFLKELGQPSRQSVKA